MTNNIGVIGLGAMGKGMATSLRMRSGVRSNAFWMPISPSVATTNWKCPCKHKRR